LRNARAPGPHSPLLNVPVHETVELQTEYIVRMLDLLARRDARSAAPTADARDRWLEEIRTGMVPTVWANGCRSWYIGPDGAAVQRPFPRDRLHDMLRQPELGDFEVRTPPALQG
jgi:hypothetical protein